jgi:hypothetical protein
MDRSEVDADVAALLDLAAAIEASSACRYRRIAAADFAYPGSPIAGHVFLMQKEAGELSPAGDPAKASLGRFRRRPSAVVSAAHPFVRQLATLHRRQPGLAAYLLLKTLHLHDGATLVGDHSALVEKTERRLLEAALAADGAKQS